MASAWRKKVSKHVFEQAQLRLAFALYHREPNIKSDPDKLMKWLRYAANNDSVKGCAAPGTRTDSLDIKQTSRDDVNVALIPAEYREVYFSAGNSNARHCRAPGPDFTVQEGMNLSLGANTGTGASENAGIGDSQSAMGLSGRSATFAPTFGSSVVTDSISSSIVSQKEIGCGSPKALAKESS